MAAPEDGPPLSIDYRDVLFRQAAPESLVAWLAQMTDILIKSPGWKEIIVGDKMAHGPGPQKLLAMAEMKYRSMIENILDGPWRNLLVMIPVMIPELSPADEATPGWQHFAATASFNYNSFWRGLLTPAEFEINLLCAAEDARRKSE